MAQRSPGKGPCSMLQRKAKKPPETLASPPWGKKSLPAVSCRAPEAIFVVREQQAVAQPKGTGGALTSGHAQCCRGRQKTPGEQGQSDPGENSFLTPELAIGYSLSTAARPASSSHSLLTPPSTCPSPSLPHSGAISGRGCPQGPRAPGLIHLGGKNPSRACQDTTGGSKALAPLPTPLHPLSYGCCPWLCRA